MNEQEREPEPLPVSAEESERGYQALVELSPEAIIVHFDGKIIYVNEAAAAMVCASSRESLIGRRFLDFIPEEYKQIVTDRTDDTLTTTQRRTLEIRSKTLDGQELYVEAMSVPLPFRGSYAHQVVLRNVTERRRAERELFRLNRALKAIIALSQTVAHAETETQFQRDACRILCDVGGYRLAWIGYPEDSPEKIITPVMWMGEEHGYLQLAKISWDEHAQDQGPAGTAMRTGVTTVLRNIQTGANRELWRSEALQRGFASIIAVPLKRGGPVFGVVTLYSRQEDAFDKEEVKLLEQLAADIAFGICTLRDREEHRKAESALDETEDRYRLLVEHSPEAIVVHCDLILEYVNPAAVKLFNAASADDLLGKHFLDFVPVEFRDEILRRSCEMKSGDKRHGGLDLTYVSETGEKMYYECVGSLTTYNGKPAAQIVIRDITERKRAEEELKTSREELRQLAAHLQSARETERTAIAREIHDELGQDLTGLKMDLAMLEDLIIEHVRPPAINEMTDRIDSMSHLLDTTVHAVRKIISELRPVLLDKLGLTAAIEWQAEEFQSRTGITCDCFITADDAAFERDAATAVYRIFQESLTNVMRHAGATRVSVSFGKEDDVYELEIRDNGKGIDDDAAARTKSFGLIGMRERAHMFNGTVTVTGEEGKGTTVTLTIPAAGLKACAETAAAAE
jgi:PAS domain S-box-containing protein